MSQTPGADTGEDADSDRRHAPGLLGDVVVVVGVLAVLGILCGIAWWLLVDPALFTKVGSGGSMGEDQLGKRFAGDGWYAVLATLAGLVAGAALMWWRSRDPLTTTVLLVLGSAVAAVTMTVTGHLLGPPSPGPVLRAAAAGALVPVRLDVVAATTYLAWPIGVLVGALLVLWSVAPTEGGAQRDGAVGTRSGPDRVEA